MTSRRGRNRPRSPGNRSSGTLSGTADVVGFVGRLAREWFVVGEDTPGTLVTCARRAVCAASGEHGLQLGRTEADGELERLTMSITEDIS